MNYPFFKSQETQVTTVMGIMHLEAKKVSLLMINEAVGPVAPALCDIHTKLGLV